jgi:RIO kinase 1
VAHRRPSGRRTFDDAHDDPVADLDLETTLTTYPNAAHGPDPVPEWLVTDPNARDRDLGVLKTGKEADVHLIERSEPDETSCLLAVKRYRSSEHRQFHRDASYLEGRRVRKSREMRAMEHRTDFGRLLLAEQWAIAEFRALSQLWVAGAPVPYPVQLDSNEVTMQFIGNAAGVAAPRLAETRPGRDAAGDQFRQVGAILRQLVDLGYAHGDLSAYNLLVDDGRIVMIDLPQVVDLAGNPQGQRFLRRDCRNIADWFASRGIFVDPDVWAEELLA